MHFQFDPVVEIHAFPVGNSKQKYIAFVRCCYKCFPTKHFIHLHIFLHLFSLFGKLCRRYHHHDDHRRGRRRPVCPHSTVYDAPACREHTATVLCVTSALNNSLIISGGEDCSIVIASFSTGKLVSFHIIDHNSIFPTN